MMASTDDSQSSGGHKSSATMTTTAMTQPLRPPEQGIKCPRCDSPNTKFCYYNNYSLTQPRHFCKTCRRYWTKGGALRNVPVGGGCRKSKKSKSSSASSPSSTSLRLPSDATDHISAIAEPSAALKFFNGLSATAMDFQLGVLPFSRLHSSNTSGVFNSGQLVCFGDFSSPTAISSLSGSSATSAVGLNNPISAVGIYSEMGGSCAVQSNTHSSLASSMESLSSINQDLHLKLQQQRLAMLFGGENHKESSMAALPTPLLESQQEAISFQLPKSSEAEACVSSVSNKGSAGEINATTTWFVDNTYTSTNGTERNNYNTSGGNNNTGNWNGIQTWNDVHQFTALP